MPRVLVAVLAALLLQAGAAGSPRPLGAQGTPADSARASRAGWNDARTRDLVERGTERRARQLADTGLTDYRATARGFLTFLAQVGEGFPDPPKIVKADQIAVEVYWRAPMFSKQLIMGRRDTLLLPTDISYHRDHLGIVQNNFPNIIRLGDGDEVRDVPHPLSREGLAAYDYAISDSLEIQIPDRTIGVYEVKVRPKDDRTAAAIGAVYLDRADAQVVRMAFSFTRTALKDQQLEDVSIVIENSLIENRFWLPSRQEIEIRRTGSWLDYPARGIIRGRWEICCYRVNAGIPLAFFRGPEIVQAPPSEQRLYPWTGRLLDSLPEDVRAVTDEDVRRVQEEARALVRSEALARTRASSLAARSVSDFVRFNRVEGLALGLGVGRRFGGGISGRLAGRYGFSDHEPKGELTLAWQQASGVGLRLSAFRAYRDAGDEPEVSLVRNTIAAQEFGSDYTDPFDVRGASLTADLGARLGLRWQLGAGYEWQEAVEVHARPASGRFEPTLPAARTRGPIARLVATRPPVLGPLGAEYQGRAELRVGAPELRGVRGLEGAGLDGERVAFARLHGTIGVERPAAAGRLVLETGAGIVSDAAGLPPQELLRAGGPVTAPGYEFHELSGRILARQRVEWRRTIPFPALPLGRYGNTGRSATLAPYVNAAYVARVADGAPRGAGWYPSAGVGLLTLFDLIRVDVARGLRDGRWWFGVDMSRAFWGIL